MAHRAASVCFRSLLAAALCLASPAVLTAAEAPAVKEEEMAIAETLKSLEDNTRAQFEEVAAARLRELEALLELPAERMAKLDPVRDKAIEQGMTAWRKRTEKLLRNEAAEAPAEATPAPAPAAPANVIPGLVEPVPQPDVMIDGSNDFSVANPKDMPDQQAAWREGLAQVLTAEEFTRYTNRRGERKARVLQCFTELLVVFLDERLALSAQQRERLRPIAEQCIPQVEELVAIESEEEEEIVNPAILLSAARHAPEKSVRALLTGAQWVRWEKVGAPEANELSEENANDGLLAGLPPGPRAGHAPVRVPAMPGGREPVEFTISRYMAAQAVAQRQRLMEPLTLQIEEIARVAVLTPDVCARLQIAARGAAERSLKDWAPRFQQYVRNNLPEPTPETVSTQLTRLGNPVVLQAAQPGTPKDGFFQKAIKAELTPEQLAAWQKEADARREFRSRAIVGAVLTGFDRLVPLSQAQFAKLSAILTGVLADYREELETANPQPQEMAPWFLQGEARYAMLAGLDPKQMKTLLGKSRWERWSKSDEFSDAKTCWDSLKENHQNRRR